MYGLVEHTVASQRYMETVDGSLAYLWLQK